ncbi:PEP/pyruvate-binding domain-containing protein [Pseudonocardia sp. MH-G8]|uniref:PEP/pyruvate-binding domain-containing protein n=1 Tax=Pseudonocardia sp. MH-G8 TaxID=1854588 RepID=UPI000BA09478|nr:PEP/pyruvate-binding domain-containing protein [Pseudonocardia sp. MH-G8]OZM81321.1 phosphoenolpyruvate synthase [Pseudonocardia sp. MH-G8]
MADYTLALSHVGRHDADLVGGKAAGLGALIGAGFPVPDGFVVTTAAYRDFLDTTGLAGRGPQELHERIPCAPVPERIVAAVRAAGAGLRGPVAVRSSGTAEDLAGASFAGQHDTYLGVDGEQAVLAAVRNCWASLWTPRAVAYRERYRWDESDLALAVVVQEMVDAEWAGVLFTADPVTGRRDRVVVEAVRGLGEALVSGTATGEHLVADKATGRPVSGAAAVPGTCELVRIGRDVEEAFGAPQDIEWAYTAGRFQLVQARPLTALPDEPDAPPRGGRRRRDYGMAADHMPFPPFPMDTSLFLRPALRAVLAATRSAGLATPTLEETVVEIDDGVVQLVPPPGVRLTGRAVTGLPRALPGLVRLLCTSTTAWRDRSDRTLVAGCRRADAADLRGLSDRELLEQVDALLATTGGLMPSRFGAVPRGVLAGAMSERLLAAVVGRERVASLHAGLMSAIPCVTTSANAALERMAATVRADPELRDAYCEEEPAQVAERLRGSAAGRALLADVDAYLREFGFREMSIFTVGLPPLRETPEVAHGLIKGLARGRPADVDAATRLARARAELACARGPRARLLAPVVRRLVDAARTAAGFREDSHYQLMMTIAVVRRVLLELGRRYCERGLLDTPDDIAYLERAEVSDLVPAAVRETVARRKAARRAALPGYTIIPAELMALPAEGSGVRGTPASRGTAVGPVRVVHDESEFATLQDGEVLVCPYTNPTWTPLFALASAVVVDAGGAASHAAIVAREHGIPAVMGTVNGTRLLVDGQRVVVDGNAGTVAHVGAAG